MLGKFQKDDDGHTYFIPVDMVDKFNESYNKMQLSEFYSDEYWHAMEEFCDKFESYKMTYFPEYYVVDLELPYGED